ncbi:MAG TPA: FTR1 family protein [Chloroflexota bacterium]|nr:FTR1 family protein [Chloroflexota bacterium]
MIGGQGMRFGMGRILLGLILPLFLALGVSLYPSVSRAADGQTQRLRDLAALLDQARGALAGGQVDTALAAFDRFRDGWEAVEDDVRARSLSDYRAIEDAMGEVQRRAAMRPVDRTGLDAALATLDESFDRYLGTVMTGGPEANAPASATPTATLADLEELIREARAALRNGQTAAALVAMRRFEEAWPNVEGQVRSRSGEAYRAIEDSTVIALAALTGPRPDPATAEQALAAIDGRLTPLLTPATAYGPLDAAAILLREGLEALLVVSALLAFLRRAGHADKGRWIWAGAAAGIGVSLLVAVLANVAFTALLTGSNREMIEGVTGLAAAIMLLYVSYWLHSRASLGAWRHYIESSTRAALARGSLLSLGLVAFLAVFREGAETVLFYLGMAPSISTPHLLMGLALGAAVLMIIGSAILFFGLRLPLRPFFLLASLLVYYLGFKFIGTGLHDLQVAGIIGTTPAPYLPSSDWLGIFPTWETTAVQLLLLVAGAAAVAVLQWRARQTADRLPA